MFQLNLEEKKELVTNWHRFSSLKHSSYLPFVFTELGVAMLAAVFNSEQAVRTSIQIIKTFIRVREFVSASVLFDERLTKLDERVENNHFKFNGITASKRKLPRIFIKMQYILILLFFHHVHR